MTSKTYIVDNEAPDGMADFYYEYLFSMGEINYEIVKRTKLSLTPDELKIIVSHIDPITYTGFALRYALDGGFMVEDPIFERHTFDAPRWVTLGEIQEMAA